MDRDIAIAEKEIYGDEGVITAKGWKGIREIGIPLVTKKGKKFLNEFPLDRRLWRGAVTCLRPVTHYTSRITKIQSGNFVTVSTVSGTRKRAQELERRFQAICENMEGAAVAQVCTIYNIPMLDIISSGCI
jgi:futalosine hydrolase